MTSEYALQLLKRISRANKKRVVTTDSLIDHKSFAASEGITTAISELRRDGLLTTRTTRAGGRFETELMPVAGFVDHGDLRRYIAPDEEPTEDVAQEKVVEVITPPKKARKRHVRRSLI